VGSNRIFLISHHPLFAEAIIHILQDEGIEVANIAASLDAALPLLKEHQPDTIIVDCGENYPPDANTVSLLTGADEDRQVIFLTLDGNQMIIHRRQHVGDATATDLVSVLRERFPLSPARGGETQ